MDFYRSNCEIIGWVDSFLFFYWDIQRYRPADAETVDRLIIDYFQRQTPSITSGENPSPWNALLCNLMRSLAYLLGFHIVTAYEHNSKEPLQWLNTWTANPFLHEFGYAHQSNHWTLPLPTHIDRILTLAWRYESDSFMCEGECCRTSRRSLITRFDLFPTARLDRSFCLVLQHTVNGDMAQVRLCYKSDRYCIPNHGLSPNGHEVGTNTRMINLGKRIFTSMLFWVDEMCRTGWLLSLCDILDRRFEQWPLSDAEDTLRVNYELWEAIINFGLRHISTKGEVWSDGADTPTTSETLWVTG
ncbi:hypothetical protein CKAH01_17266 [Colletotrichum kahawae]|uniref:Uncharacterized protein n=1 Tax=Colletotrichum kahawae TaxID=34407 RepID=A0AAD9YCP2_COLKA|nr:hypothetical protein CKAH01_17266 [Colletotrichum kahawae]